MPFTLTFDWLAVTLRKVSKACRYPISNFFLVTSSAGLSAYLASSPFRGTLP